MEELQKLCGIIVAIKTMLSFFDFTDRNSNCSHIFQQNLNSFLYKQPSHLSQVQQWRQSPHGMEELRKFWAITTIVNTMLVHSSQKGTQTVCTVLNGITSLHQFRN